eukprot:TRINITY_DN63214_c0_g1_i1.p1 TRINITY_DN63214_c0_g1~~TRINITY_DN63214_c0_g1_i1.p1  ORF type:complete len:501 (-),score=31.75 TRINITY_DN63214_c0_g1_i1:79-1581(-)
MRRFLRNSTAANMKCLQKQKTELVPRDAWKETFRPSTKTDILFRAGVGAWKARNARSLWVISAATALLLPFELTLHLLDCLLQSCMSRGILRLFTEQDVAAMWSVSIWKFHQRCCRSWIFRFYFNTISEVPHSSELAKKSEAGESKVALVIFASNHPTGLLDRLLMQCLTKGECYCLKTGVDLPFTNSVETTMALPPAGPAGTPDSERFRHIIDTLFDSAVMKAMPAHFWIAVGGARELHPYISKVHTGAARIAIEFLQTYRERIGDDAVVRIVPTHIAFECHLQPGSGVAVEYGIPLDVRASQLDTSDLRKLARDLTTTVEARLRELVDWIPPDLAQDFGKKGRRGQGQIRLAAEQWRTVRMADVAVSLLAGRPLPWCRRVAAIRRMLRAALFPTSGAPAATSGNVSSSFAEFCTRFRSFESKFGLQFRPPSKGSITWDLTAPLKLVPRLFHHEEATTQALRNFSYSLFDWDPSVRLSEEYRSLVDAAESLRPFLEQDP